MITPAPGYIVDPNNPNGVIPDPKVSTRPDGTPSTATAPTTALGAVQTNPAPIVPDTTGTNTPIVPTDTSSTVSPEDAKLLALGVTPDQLKALNTPQGLDPASFQSLIGNVETKLKTNNDLVTQRGYLMKHLYDSPLTPDELTKLSPDIQKVVSAGNKDDIELQLRLINDQIAGRAQTLSQSVKYLTDGYQTAVDDAEQKKQDAVSTVLKFVDAYGSQAKSALTSLYGKDYISQLKDMGINIDTFSSTKTLDQIAAEKKAATTGTTDTTNATLERILGGGGKLKDLTPTEKTKIENKLYSIGFYDEAPPDWFREAKEEQLKMNFTAEALKKIWDEYKAGILGGSGSSDSTSDLSYENIPS